MVFVDVTRQPKSAARKPNMLKLSSVIEVSIMPPTTGSRDNHTLLSNTFLHTSHCKSTVTEYLISYSDGATQSLAIHGQ